MKITTIFTAICIVFSMRSFAAKNDTTHVRGLLYSDENPVSVEIVDGIIVDVIHLPKDSDVPGVYVGPGLIDLQINGYMGVSFTDQSIQIEDIRNATKALWEEGVTSYLPTLTTLDRERLLKSFALLAKAMKDEEIGLSIPGFHLEGPYISPVKGYRGAHFKQFIRLPDWDEFLEMQKAAGHGIKLITVAPELEGAISFMKKCVAMGVVVSLGHHNGDAEIVQRAVDVGASLSTHLGNGCANMINRHNNPLWPQLANDKLSISIIADGFHLTRDEVRTFYKVKGPDKTILVSDILSLAGQPPGIYIDEGDTLLLTEDVVKYPAENVLCGAAKPISKDVGNVMKFTQCSIKDAIHMASKNPADLIGLSDRGEIRFGKRADLICFTLEKGDVVIQKTIIAGKTVYSKDK